MPGPRAALATGSGGSINGMINAVNLFLKTAPANPQAAVNFVRNDYNSFMRS